MAERKQFRAIKGTRDILPPDSSLWNWFEQGARDVFESYNYHEIRLPMFEETELFARSIGVETDVVGKEMYTFQDRPPDWPSPTPFLHPESYTRAFEEMMQASEALATVENRSAWLLSKSTYRS